MLLTMGKKSPKGSQYTTTEQQRYHSKIKDFRSKFKPPRPDGKDSNSKEIQNLDKTRQPPLAGLTSDYDLKLFLEAQAAASEKIVRFIL